MSRTNVEVDDAVIARVMSRAEALAMRGSGWEGDLDELRAGYQRSL